MTMLISEVCTVKDMPDHVYHGDPVEGGSLSYTGMKELLKSPAHYRHYIDQPRVEKRVFDEGTIVHSLVLGTPLDLEVLDFDSYRTKAAQAARNEAYAAGATPVLYKDLAPLELVAEAVLAHPQARPLFENDGPTELSMFAPEPETGVWLRGRADKISTNKDDYTVLVDLKTTLDADPQTFNRKAIAQYKYFLQAYVYTHLYKWTHKLDHIPEMLFVAVTKTEPHLVSVTTLDWAYDDLGERDMREALNRYKQCTATGEWPGYEGVHTITPPAYLMYDLEEEMEI